MKGFAGQIPALPLKIVNLMIASLMILSL